MKLLLSFIFLFSIQVSASETLHLRNDRSIPEHCQSSEISDFFSDDLKYFTYSRTGGEKRGFDYEYEIGRKDIRALWGIFKGGNKDDSGRSWAGSDPDRLYCYNAINENYKKMDFDFNEEGQVLEILTLLKIKENLTDDMYVTGSVAYSGNRSHNRLGELDIVVGDVKTCKILYVGEVKINPKRLGHARSQLQRFRRFIENEKGDINRKR